MCSLQRNYDVIRNWERFETGPLTVFESSLHSSLRVRPPLTELYGSALAYYTIPIKEFGTHTPYHPFERNSKALFCGLLSSTSLGLLVYP